MNTEATLVRQHNRQQEHRVFKRLDVVLDLAIDREHVFAHVMRFGRRLKTNSAAKAVHCNACDTTKNTASDASRIGCPLG